MKNICVLLVFFFALSLKAQDPGDSVLVKEAFIGHSYIVNNHKVSRSIVRYIIRSDARTNSLLTASETARIAGNVILVASGISAVFVFNDALTDRYNYGQWFPALSQKNTLRLLGTTGGLVFGLLCLHEGNYKFQKAIKLYNHDLPLTKKTSELKFNLGLNSVGVTYIF